ncbi:MAG: dephospho-CoA kinase [Planctomycetota bacterium]
MTRCPEEDGPRETGSDACETGGPRGPGDQAASAPLRTIPVIGLAGGVGSGKSTVARVFERLGCVVSDSDAEAKACLTRPEVIAELVSWWGKDVLDQSGAVDRGRVAAIVFTRPAERERLETLIHPLVKRSRADLVAEATHAKAAGVIVDAPLLFEAGLDTECDLTVFVDAPFEVRRQRVVEKRGWSVGELERRESAQMPLQEKRRRSDVVLENTSGRGDLEDRARVILESARARIPRT